MKDDIFSKDEKRKVVLRFTPSGVLAFLKAHTITTKTFSGEVELQPRGSTK